MKKISIVKGIFSAVLYLLTFLILALLALVFVFGMKLYCIETGSMSPTYPVGTLIIVEPVEFEQLDQGDVITFVSGGVTVTHRVVSVDSQTKQLATKGDNNNVADSSAVSFENVVGRVWLGVPFAGYLVLILNTTFGRIMTGVLLFGVVGIALILRMHRASEPDDDEEAEAEKA